MERPNTIEIGVINQRLISQYGRHTVANRANFRLSFGPDQVEKRLSTKSHYLGDIFLREETGIFELPKYEYLTEDGRIWILERLIGNVHPDVFGEEWSYEPLYSFKPFPPYRALELFINGFINRTPHKRTEKSDLDDYCAAIEKEKVQIKDSFGNFTPLGTSLEDGSAVSYTNGDYRPSKQVNDV